MLLHRWNLQSILKEFIVKKDVEYETKIADLQKGIVRLEKKL